MRKILLSAAFIAAMVLGSTATYAQTPTKKVAKTEQTATKKVNGEKKECKKACAKKMTSPAKPMNSGKKAVKK